MENSPVINNATVLPRRFYDVGPSSSNGLATTQEVNPLLDYLGVLRINKAKILSAMAVGLILGLALTTLQKPKFEAKTSLEIQGLNDDFLNMKNVDPLTAGEYSSESYLQTQIKILQSRSLIEKAALKLRMLDQGPAGAPAQPSLVGRLLGSKESTPLSVRQARLAGIASNLKVQASGLTRIVDISYESPNPQLAADFVNTLAQAYVDQSADARFQTTRATSEWLNKQLEDMKSKLEKSDDELQSYARKANLMITGEKDNLAEEKLRELQNDLVKAQADRAVKQAHYELAKTSPAASIPDIVEDPSLRDYQLKFTDLRRQLAELSTTLTPDHFRVKQVQAQITELESALESRRADIIQRIGNDFAAAQRREQLVMADYAAHARLVSDQSVKAIHYDILKRDLDSGRQLYDDVLQKVKEAQIGSALKTSNIRVIDAAEPPSHPTKPSLLANSALGLFFGTFAGIVFITVKRQSNRTIQDPGQGSMYLNLPELGVIPAAKGAQRLGRITWELKPSMMAEAFRATLASIVFSATQDQERKVLVITSPERAEGKSTVVSNLAIALAEIGKRVLVIDGDIRRPAIHTIFDLPNGPGLTDVLLDSKPIEKVDFGSIFRSTSVPHLFVLPSGEAGLAAANLLYSSRTDELLERCRREFDFILIDTPPMLQIPDARVLGRASDGVILVLRSWTTTRETAMMAAQRFMDDSTPVLGVILNSWDPTKTVNSPYGRYAAEKYGKEWYVPSGKAENSISR